MPNFEFHKSLPGQCPVTYHTYETYTYRHQERDLLLQGWKARCDELRLSQVYHFHASQRQYLPVHAD